MLMMNLLEDQLIQPLLSMRWIIIQKNLLSGLFEELKEILIGYFDVLIGEIIKY